MVVDGVLTFFLTANVYLALQAETAFSMAEFTWNMIPVEMILSLRTTVALEKIHSQMLVSIDIMWVRRIFFQSSLSRFFLLHYRPWLIFHNLWDWWCYFDILSTFLLLMRPAKLFDYLSLLGCHPRYPLLNFCAFPFPQYKANHMEVGVIVLESWGVWVCMEINHKDTCRIMQK